MQLTRRDCVRGALGLAALVSVSGCRSIEDRISAGMISEPSLALLQCVPEMRLLQRATYGPATYELACIRNLGATGWLDAQLRPDTIDEAEVLDIRLEPLKDVLDADPGLLFDMDDHQAVHTLRQATLLRAVYSRRQLYERLVGFWSDHFNIYAYKGEDPQYLIVEDRETIRKHALGAFRELLGASAKSAAMIGFLDTSSNVKGLPNENYARELMELHTMGVGSGYTQADVHNVARCFTGWTIAQHWHRGQFVFDSSAHDFGEKHVLGHVIPAGGGVSDGETVLDIVASHPATAKHLTYKLLQAFVGGSPSSLHDRLADTFMRTGGQIAPVVRELFASDELVGAAPMLKRPLDYMVSSLRAVGADTDGGAGVQAHLAAMGQAPFAWPMPDGYPVRESAWITGLIPRWRYAGALVGGEIGGTSVDWNALAAGSAAHMLSPSAGCARMLFGSENGAAQAAMDHYGGADLPRTCLIGLMSPEFQYH